MADCLKDMEFELEGFNTILGKKLFSALESRAKHFEMLISKVRRAYRDNPKVMELIPNMEILQNQLRGYSSVKDEDSCKKVINSLWSVFVEIKGNI